MSIVEVMKNLTCECARTPAMNRIPNVLLCRDDNGEHQQQGRRVSSGQAVYEFIIVAELHVLYAES